MFLLTAYANQEHCLNPTTFDLAFLNARCYAVTKIQYVGKSIPENASKPVLLNTHRHVRSHPMINYILYRRMFLLFSLLLFSIQQHFKAKRVFAASQCQGKMTSKPPMVSTQNAEILTLKDEIQSPNKKDTNSSTTFIPDSPRLATNAIHTAMPKQVNFEYEDWMSDMISKNAFLI